VNGQEKHATMRKEQRTEDRGQRAKRIEQRAWRRERCDFGLRIADCGFQKNKRQKGFAILDCAHVKSALPFHIRENLTPVRYSIPTGLT